MDGQRFSEKDWRLFRSKLAAWQESFMDRLNREYIQLLSGDGAASDKFWELDRRLKADKRKTGVRLRMSRSDMILNIISLIDEGVIAFEDLDEFSDTFQVSIKFILDGRREREADVT